MGLWPFESDPPANALAPETVRDLLREAVELKEYALLTTPYLTFPGRLLHLERGEVRMGTTLTKDVAQRTLNGGELRLRLPWRLSMVAGPVAYKGHRKEEHRRELVLSRPAWLVPDEQRKQPRCELVGKSTFTITREDLQQVRGLVENLSLSGAGIFTPEPEAAGLLHPGLSFELGLRLDQGPELRTRARIVHGDFPRMGLIFTEAWGAAEAAQLQGWLKPRYEEALRRWENRVALRAQAEAAARLRAQGAQWSGVLIVGSHLFAEEVGDALEGLETLKSGPPSMAPLKRLVVSPPLLVVLQVTQGDLEERYRLRALWQALNLACPLIVLGTGSPGCAQELGMELRAAGSLQWDPARVRFFRRMAQGLIQRGRGDEEEGNPARGG